MIYNGAGGMCCFGAVWAAGWLRLVVLAGGFLSVLPGSVAGASVSLLWDPSPDTNAIGYAVYYGSLGTPMPDRIDVGNVTNAPVNGLQPGFTYFFYVTAYDSAGDESVPSNVIEYTVPPSPNTAPVLGKVSDQSVRAGTTLAFAVTAEDQDQPPQILTFSLDAGAPAGAGLDPATGMFSWTPSYAQVGVYSVTLRVTDNGTPALSDSATISIEVVEPVAPPLTILIAPFLHPATLGNGAGGLYPASLSWDAGPSDNASGYRLYFGPISRLYTNEMDTGTATTAVVPDLAEGVGYYFAVTAYDEAGNESDFSNEIFVMPQPPVQPALIPLTGKVLLSMNAQLGHTYDILASDSGSGWFLLKTVTAGQSGSLDFLDPAAPGSSGRLYRVVDTSGFRPQLALGVTSDNRAVLTGSGLLGHRYDILAGDSLKRWQVIGAVDMGESGSFEFVDADAASRPARFYRVTDVPAVPPELQLLLAPDGLAHLTVNGLLGHTYDIQATSDFADWTVVGSGTVDDTGSFESIDAQSAAFRARFYRIVDRVLSPPGLQVSVTPDGQILLGVRGRLGRTYDILGGPSPDDWALIGTVTLTDCGTTSLVSPYAADSLVGFYRMVEVVPFPPSLAVCAKADGRIHLTVTGQLGHAYEILGSGDFVNWTVLGTGTVEAGSVFEWVDPDTAPPPARFYRARESAR